MLDAKCQVSLAKLMIERYQEIQKRQQESQQGRFFRRRALRTNLNLGANGGEVFEYDLEFLSVANKILSFGRIDGRSLV